jgi:hypothetical protein
MPAWSSWVLTDQAAIDACAEDLMTAGWYNEVKRGHDDSSPPNPLRNIMIHDPADELKNYNPRLGQAVVLMGSTLLVLSQADFEASPFYQAP